MVVRIDCAGSVEWYETPRLAPWTHLPQSIGGGNTKLGHCGIATPLCWLIRGPSFPTQHRAGAAAAASSDQSVWCYIRQSYHLYHGRQPFSTMVRAIYYTGPSTLQVAVTKHAQPLERKRNLFHLMLRQMPAFNRFPGLQNAQPSTPNQGTQIKRYACS